MTADVVFLLDVDNTLLDGDLIVVDLREEPGYVDYLGALQRYRPPTSRLRPSAISLNSPTPISRR